MSFAVWYSDGSSLESFQHSMMRSPVSTFFMGRNNTSDPGGWVADALKYISTVRIQVYEHPRLAKLEASRSEGCSARAMMERERRDKERDLFKELSQYYPLEVVGESDVNRRVWERPNLLKEGKFKLDHS